ncbi:MAG: hypothetical protein R3Y64_06435 [Peptostreptococcaceae bacterium]
MIIKCPIKRKILKEVGKKTSKIALFSIPFIFFGCMISKCCRKKEIYIIEDKDHDIINHKIEEFNKRRITSENNIDSSRNVMNRMIDRA